jgi:integrase
MLARANGLAWGPSHQIRWMAEACRAARITPSAGFHILRHTNASHLVMSGVPLNVVAHNLGHADRFMAMPRLRAATLKGTTQIVKLRHSVTLEVVLSVLVLGASAILGITMPPQ